MILEKERIAILPPTPGTTPGIPSGDTVDSGAKSRHSWYSFIIFPDNPMQMIAFEYLQALHMDGAYIEHEPEADEKKKHIHYMIRFDYARTPAAIIKSFGAAPAAVESVDEKGNPVFRMLSPDENPDEVAAKGYQIQQKNIFSFPTTCDYTRCPEAELKYLLHADFRSKYIDKKKEYPVEDLHFTGDIDKMTAMLSSEYDSYCELIGTLKEYSVKYKTPQAVLDAAMGSGRYDIIKYLSSHAYFVSTFFCKGGE